MRICVKCGEDVEGMELDHACSTVTESSEAFVELTPDEIFERKVTRQMRRKTVPDSESQG